MTGKIKRNISSTRFLTLGSMLNSFPTQKTCFAFLFLFLPPIFTLWKLLWFVLLVLATVAKYVPELIEHYYVSLSSPFKGIGCKENS